MSKYLGRSAREIEVNKSFVREVGRLNSLANDLLKISLEIREEIGVRLSGDDVLTGLVKLLTNSRFRKQFEDMTLDLPEHVAEHFLMRRYLNKVEEVLNWVSEGVTIEKVLDFDKKYSLTEARLLITSVIGYDPLCRMPELKGLDIDTEIEFVRGKEDFLFEIHIKSIKRNIIYNVRRMNNVYVFYFKERPRASFQSKMTDGYIEDNEGDELVGMDTNDFFVPPDDAIPNVSDSQVLTAFGMFDD